MGAIQSALNSTISSIKSGVRDLKLVGTGQKLVGAAKTANDHLSGILQSYQKQADMAEAYAKEAEHWRTMNPDTKKSLTSALQDIQTNFPEGDNAAVGKKIEALGSFSDYVAKEKE